MIHGLVIEFAKLYIGVNQGALFAGAVVTITIVCAYPLHILFEMVLKRLIY